MEIKCKENLRRANLNDQQTWKDAPGHKYSEVEIKQCDTTLPNGLSKKLTWSDNNCLWRCTEKNNLMHFQKKYNSNDTHKE